MLIAVIILDLNMFKHVHCISQMWSCARGKSEAALVLYHWNTIALYVCNKEGEVPLSIARRHGNTDLAAHIQHLELIRQENRHGVTGTQPATPQQTGSKSLLDLIAPIHNR